MAKDATVELTAYPNPFSEKLNLAFTLVGAGEANLMVTDLQGRKLATIALGYQESGTHTFEWNAEDADGKALPNGLYFVQLSHQNQKVVVRVVLMR